MTNLSTSWWLWGCNLTMSHPLTLRTFLIMPCIQKKTLVMAPRDTVKHRSRKQNKNQLNQPSQLIPSWLPFVPSPDTALTVVRLSTSSRGVKVILWKRHWLTVSSQKKNESQIVSFWFWLSDRPDEGRRQKKPKSRVLICSRVSSKGNIIFLFSPLNQFQTGLTATFAFLQWAGQTSARAEGGGWRTEGEGCLLATGLLPKYLLSQTFFFATNTVL